jgi:integrase/recombinase XerC
MAHTISEAIEAYLESVSLARSANTARTYRNAMTAFRATLADHGLPTTSSVITDLSENVISWFVRDMKAFSPATERLYLTAITGFYQFLIAESLADFNLPRLRLLIRQRSRRPGLRLPQFPRKDIEDILDYANNDEFVEIGEDRESLRNLRDRAFLLVLADTGLRVHEACKLRRGDIDWTENKAVITGKGNRQAVVRFSKRSISSLRRYLNTRGKLDGSSGRPLSALPLFARHDRGAGKHIKKITTRTGQNIISRRVGEALGKQAIGTITPHSFRHYFVTTVLRGSGGNLKMAQELARHKNIQVTQRYAHLSDDELDRGYWDIFNE